MNTKPLNLVFYSPSFLPTIGGLENVMYDWAFQLTQIGHKVLVITEREGDRTDDSFPFEVKRKLSQTKIWQLMRKSDAVIHFNISLKAILPTLLSFKPFFVSHHSTLKDVHGKWTKLGQLKTFISNTFTRKNICCSNFVASFLKNTTVVYSPYRPNIFSTIVPFEERKDDIVFAGRLVSDKGCEVLLQSLVVLRNKYGLSPKLTIAGNGDDKQKLESIARDNDLGNQVNFIGSITPKQMALLLNSNKIMVVPSTWEEPFGIVALEGIAAGCIMLASNAGGLPEAVGNCGYLFEKGNADELALLLQKLLTSSQKMDEEKAAKHLEHFTDSYTANQFAEVVRASIHR
jgi:glycosyltransferase involved in cell wall biosynthesis